MVLMLPCLPNSTRRLWRFSDGCHSRKSHIVHIAPNSGLTSSVMLPREMQCAYRSKFCNAPRATKLDGTLHKLCDFHRRKANANQQRLHKRKKRILEQQAAAAPQSPTSGRAMKRVHLSSESPQDTTEPIDGLTFQNSFDLLEVKILEVLLFGSECTAVRQPPQLLMKEEDSFHPVSPTTPSMTSVPVFDDAWPVTL